MTLLQLLKQIRRIEDHFITTEGIPLKMHNCDIDLELELQGENGDYWVDVKLKRKPVNIEEFKEIVKNGDSKVKITRDIHLESQTQSSLGDIEI